MKKNRETRTQLLMILPAFIGFLIFFILPAFFSLLMSFTNWSLYYPKPTFVGLRNFQSLFGDAKTVAAIWHSILYALLITVFQNVPAMLLAIYLNRKDRISSFVRGVFFLPAVLSILVVGYLFSYMMTSADYGVLNYIIRALGGRAVNWLGDGSMALISILITQVWQWMGWSMVIYIANLRAIPADYCEAARIDGASRGQLFFHITLPLLYPALSFNILMSMIGGLKVFDIVFSLTKGGPGYATETIITTMIREGFNTGRNAYACAIAVVFFVIVFVFSRFMTYWFNRWEKAIA